MIYRIDLFHFRNPSSSIIAGFLRDPVLVGLEPSHCCHKRMDYWPVPSNKHIPSPCANIFPNLLIITYLKFSMHITLLNSHFVVLVELK